MKVDIYLKERNGNREIRFPWLPETIEMLAGDTSVASYDILDKGEVAVPTGTGLATYSWESVFPGKRTDTSMLRGTWKEPKTFHNTILDWMEKKTPLRILVTGYPINDDVFIESYQCRAEGGFGDLEYEIVLKEDRDIKVTATKIESPKRNETQSSTTDYIIKKGDTLWGIAERFLGSGSKWKIIYDANKEIIESTAKKRWKAAGINRDSQNGHWIFPGTKIKIPTTSTKVPTTTKSYSYAPSTTPAKTTTVDISKLPYDGSTLEYIKTQLGRM